MTNTHEQQQTCQPLHRPTWRSSNGLGRLRNRFQNLPTEVLLVIIEHVLQPEAQKPKMQALAEHLYLGLLNDRFRELMTPILESHVRSNFSRNTNASMGTTSQTDPGGLYSYILILSTIRGFPEGVNAALDLGADINANDGIDKSLAANEILRGKPEPKGSCLTSLHWAAFNRDTAMLRLLLDRGADVQRTTHSSIDRNLIRTPPPDSPPKPNNRCKINTTTRVNALGFALQANYSLLPGGMTEQQRKAFVVDRDTRDEEAVRILIEAGCPASVMVHREREFKDACELGRWGVARDILANMEWRRRCAERDEYNSRPSAPLSLKRVARGRNPSRRVVGYHANEW
ncbi:hypothetical protein CTAM01_09672 [Colletotrichum tamarilloi]|uniref:Ankyrin repeat protein n=1 Tax=Colletotrichum tamarilloi TaxID=1209934 RepID=A0ABQ9R2S9_9PEZI|nr:uncharacterized protein CTAM01_09672 [Colletotrichum tamarilloi]KAK1493045.1 hypothetical protein CTAM01_09672 [Colletotrichum tamarilloi]